MSLRGAKRRGNLLVQSIVLHGIIKHRTEKLPRQDFDLPRNDMVVGSWLHLLLLLRKTIIYLNTIHQGKQAAPVGAA